MTKSTNMYLLAGFFILAGCAEPKSKKVIKAGSGVELDSRGEGVEEGEDIDSFGDLLQLAQNIADKQKSAGEGICSGGACLANVNTCEKLNFGKLKYSFSADDGGKCVLDAQISCEAWEKKAVRKLPAFDSEAGKWIAIDVEFCETDEQICNNTRFNKNGAWYRSSATDIQEISYFNEDGSFRSVPPDQEDAELSGTQVTRTVPVCERLDDYCKDSFGVLSSVSHSVNSGTGRSINTCSVSPEFCRSKDMYLNSTNVKVSDENDIGITEVDAIEWESECVELEEFKANKLICTAHGMEFDLTNRECYSDTKASCDNSGKVWVSDSLLPKYHEILKTYKYIYDLEKKNGQNTELDYAGFTYVDHTLANYQILGLEKEEATFKGRYPVKPGKRCQYPNIETCKLIDQVFDPYQNKCVDSVKRNLMLVLRKIEIDNSMGCIDSWMEREGPTGAETFRNVALSIVSVGMVPAMGGWSDGTDVRKEAPFTYEVGDFKFLTSTGEGGELLKKPVKNIAVPHKESYAFLVSKIFPVEIKGAGFNFSVKFDVFVKGKSITAGKLLFGSVLEDFHYTDTHFPYVYKTLWRSKDTEDNVNNTGLESLFAELKSELSRRHIVAAGAESSSWFKQGVQNIRLDSGKEDDEEAKKLAGNHSTRLSYTINRSNWDDSLHKISRIIHFNPTQVYSQEIARGGNNTDLTPVLGAGAGGVVGGLAKGSVTGAVIGGVIGAVAGASGTDGSSPLQEIEQKRCYGRLVWSWQWFKG